MRWPACDGQHKHQYTQDVNYAVFYESYLETHSLAGQTNFEVLLIKKEMVCSRR